MSKLARLAAELERRGRRETFTAETVCGDHVPQLRAIRSSAKRKVLCCGRRAGKTVGIAIALLLRAVGTPGAKLLYVTLTRANAKEIIWDDLDALNTRFNLGGVWNLSELTLRFPNGSQIQLRGAHTGKEIAKYRGKFFHLVVVDEIQSFPDRILVPLLKDVIGPTMIDYGGEMWLVGTKQAVHSGFWWESYAGKLASKREQHAWTLLDNVKLPARVAGADPQAILAAVREEFGWDENNPTYQREYLNVDVEDLDCLLYEYRPDRNGYAELPEGGEWTYVIGVDIGFNDSDGIAVLGWRKHDRVLYLVEEDLGAGRDVTDLAEQVTERVERYNPIAIVLDQGGLGKKIAAELQNRHALPIQPADKQQKGAYIKLLNADLRKGKLLARTGSAFAEDCKLVKKDPEALIQEKLQELPASKGGYHSDICDAVLYAWREALAHFEEPAPEKPKDEGDALMQARAERMKREAQRPWWESQGSKLGFG